LAISWKSKMTTAAVGVACFYLLGLALMSAADLWLYKDYAPYVFEAKLLTEGPIGLVSLLLGVYGLRIAGFERLVGLVRGERWLAAFGRMALDERLAAGTVLLLASAAVIAVLPALTPLYDYRSVAATVLGLTLAALFAVPVALVVRGGWRLISDRGKFREQWRQTYTSQKWLAVRQGLGSGKMLAVLIAYTLFTGIAVFAAWELLDAYHDSQLDWFFILCLALYALVVVPAALIRLGAFNGLYRSVKAMAEGNLNVTVKADGTGVLAEMAEHINNMKHAYRKSLEGRIKSERMKTELITNVSHDLKTPLTSIINFVGLLKNSESASADEINRYIEVLDQKTQRLKILIDDLFEASKMASGAVELDIEKVDLCALSDQAVAEFGDKLEHAKLTCRVRQSAQHIYAPLDGRKTWRVFENLIGNAIKYALPGTRIFITLDQDDDFACFRIQNTSSYEIDFEAEELFERFKRADLSRQTEGSGLGLAIAKSIVELQSGSIHIDIDGDQFSIRIKFPRFVSELQAPGA